MAAMSRTFPGLFAVSAMLGALVLLEVAGLPREVSAAGWCVAAAFGAWWAGTLTAAGLIVIAAGLRAGLLESAEPWSGLTAALGAVVLSCVSGQVSRALRRERELARCDPLTKLPNRQSLAEHLDAEIARSTRFQRPFTLVMIDCDGFKALNDRHGHSTGDILLQRLADALRRSVRVYDFVCRLAGDEFVLILSEAGPAEAEVALERLWLTVRSELADEFPGVSFSAGVVTFPPGVYEPAECLQMVDAAMYSAKRTGKARTVFTEAPSQIEKPSDFGMSVMS